MGKYLASSSRGASDVLHLHRRVDARDDWDGEAWAPTFLRRLHASAARRGAVTAATGARWPSRLGFESTGRIAGALPFSAFASLSGPGCCGGKPRSGCRIGEADRPVIA